MLLVSSRSGLWPLHWNQALSREWSCRWSSADRRCSNYIWVINNFIAYHGTSYVRDLTVIQWNLYNKTGKTLLKTHKFHHLPGTVFTKSCLFSLSWETTSLERPQNWVVSLYRFHCREFTHFLKSCRCLMRSSSDIRALSWRYRAKSEYVSNSMEYGRKMGLTRKYVYNFISSKINLWYHHYQGINRVRSLKIKKTHQVIWTFSCRAPYTVKCRYNAVFGVQEINRVIVVTAL